MQERGQHAGWHRVRGYEGLPLLKCVEEIGRPWPEGGH